MSTNSETIIPSTSRTLHGSASLTGDPYKGDGFYGRSDGLHTVQVSITDFIGRISIQGTLEGNPTESDWFTVELGTGTISIDTPGLVGEQKITVVDYTAATTNTKTYNFIGNLVWVRAKISNWTDGAINSIKLNH